MSNFFLADRIKETSRTEGTTSIVLDGSVAGFSSFDDFYASGDVVFYAITDNSKYEIGSGIYEMVGGSRTIGRHPIRSSDMNSGPWFVQDGSDYYYPLWLTRSAAQSGVGFGDGPYSATSGITFNDFPGQTFYYATEHAALAVGSLAGSGSSFNDAADPVSFVAGLKEVFVTYPGKTAVLNAYGIDATVNEPQESGIAVWKNNQVLNYTSKLVWDEDNKRLGIDQASPQYSIDIGGEPAHSIVNASGYIEGGSGILFSGGQLTYTGLTASGGKQLEPFLRNQLGDGADGLLQVSGVVDQFIGLRPQSPGLVFAGPDPSYCGTGNCPPQAPTFRLITLDDIPVSEIGSSGGFIVQNNAGIDGISANISPNNFSLGMVAIYGGSGEVTYDSGIFFDYTNDRLLVGGNASTDTALYTLDVRGDLSAVSGYLNQLMFQDGLIRIGDNAGTDNGNLTENFYVISLGNNSAFGASGLFDTLSIGRFAALTATLASGTSFIGVSAGEDSVSIIESFIAGTNAGEGAVHHEGLVAIGRQAGMNSSGINDNVYIGTDAGLNASGNIEGVSVGKLAGSESSNLDTCVIIGDEAGVGMFDAIENVVIGHRAGTSTAGDNNVYVGPYAGSGLLGDNNIEVVSTSSGWIGQNDSNKLNIEQTIAGDTSAGRISIGAPSGTDPIATLVVEPADVNDASFIVRMVGSGSITNPVEVQSGDGTVQYSISNSGDVYGAGWMQPSGGLWLNDADPTRNSGVGGHMLWNDSNTLIWNGAPVGGAGSFTSWTATTAGASNAVSDSQAVTFSGVSGVGVSQPSSRTLIFDGSTLSGICVELSGQITAADYTFFTAASGAGSNNNDPFTMEKNSVLAMSGVSGINIDFVPLTDGTNNSGIFKIGYDISNTYTFNVTNGENPDDIITNTETVTISGVSGVRVEYADIAGGAFFRVAAPELSGVFRNDINAQGSGTTAVSGIAVWSSGEFARLGLDGVEGTSGVKLQDSHYIMDPEGSGSLNSLNFPGGRILIGSYADGSRPNIQDIDGAILIGSGAGEGSITFGDEHVIAIGTDAMGGNSAGARLSTIAIGHKAFPSEPNDDTTYCIAIGYNTLASSHGSYNVGIGYQANFQNTVSQNGRNSSYNIAIGQEAAKEQDGLSTGGHDISIGSYAGRFAHSGEYNVGIGYQAFGTSVYNENGISIGRGAGYTQKFGFFNINLGYSAGWNASGISRGILIGEWAGAGLEASTVGVSTSKFVGIGSFALNNTEDADQAVAIGTSAGGSCSGIQNSVFLGSYAGYKRSSEYSFIVSNSATPPSTYDSTWCAHDQNFVIDICDSIQGVGNTASCNLNIGKILSNTSKLFDATLTVHADDDDDSALILRANGTSQAAGLLKANVRSGVSNQGALNEVINEKGNLRLTRVTSKSGSGNSTVLLADNGNTIDAGPGVVVAYEFGADQGIAVSLYDSGAGSYVWFKIPTTTKF